MNALNDSVIICDISPKLTGKKTLLGTKKSKKNGKKSFYESPLKHIELSNKRWKQIQMQQKLINSAKQTHNTKKNSFFPIKDASLHDSVIIVSDNENELDHHKDQNNHTKKTRKRKRSLETLTKDKESSQCSNNSTKISCEEDTEIEVEICPKRKKGSPTLSDSNSPCFLISDTEDSEIVLVDVNSEGIAPISSCTHQNSDDIVVVWSSKKTSPSSENCLGHGEIQDTTTEEKDKIFMIDCTPNPENLSLLECNEETVSDKCDKNAGKNIESKIKENTKKGDEQQDLDRLPFSTEGLKLPKAQNISKMLVIEKPKRNTFLHLKRNILRSSTSTPASSTSAVCTETVESPTSEPSGLVTSELDSSKKPSNRLREIIIDGNNVAMAHKNGTTFSEEGIVLVMNYFQRRGHTVKVFIPQYRRSPFSPLLERLYKQGTVIFTPSRKIGGRWITPYDDRFILEYATVSGGIVISLDQYRDLYQEKPEWRNTIERRLLAPTFVGDYVMFPEDPLGRDGPSLDQFLRY